MATNKKVTTKVGGTKRSAQTQATPDSSPHAATAKAGGSSSAVALQPHGHPPIPQAALPGAPKVSAAVKPRMQPVQPSVSPGVSHEVPVVAHVTPVCPLPHVPAVPLQSNGSPAAVHQLTTVATVPAVPTAPQVNHVPNVPPNVQPNIPPVEQGGSAAQGRVPPIPQVNHVPYVPPNVHRREWPSDRPTNQARSVVQGSIPW